MRPAAPAHEEHDASGSGRSRDDDDDGESRGPMGGGWRASLAALTVSPRVPTAFAAQAITAAEGIYFAATSVFVSVFWPISMGTQFALGVFQGHA